jgi:DNA polymerase IIIc chi subunit
MTQLDFYHITKSTTKQTLEKLLARAIADGGINNIILANSANHAQRLSAMLWENDDPTLFLANYIYDNDNNDDEDNSVNTTINAPICITHQLNATITGQFLFILSSNNHNDIMMTEFSRVFILFMGNNDNELNMARSLWQQHKKLTKRYFQQDNTQGKWSLKISE